MLQAFVEAAAEIVPRYAADPRAASEILNDLFGAALKARGVGRVVVAGKETLVLTVRGRRGRLPENAARENATVRAGARTIELDVAKLSAKDGQAAARELDAALNAYLLDGEGAHVWIVPDGFLAELSERERRWAREGGGYFSHESLCVQNTGARASKCELFVYFEEAGREVLRHVFEAPARRSIHLRLDKIPGPDGAPFIPKSQPVGYKIVSYDAPVVVQGSRILTSGKESEFASFGTGMAWTPL